MGVDALCRAGVASQCTGFVERTRRVAEASRALRLCEAHATLEQHGHPGHDARGPSRSQLHARAPGAPTIQGAHQTCKHSMCSMFSLCVFRLVWPWGARGWGPSPEIGASYAVFILHFKVDISKTCFCDTLTTPNDGISHAKASSSLVSSAAVHGRGVADVWTGVMAGVVAGVSRNAAPQHTYTLRNFIPFMRAALYRRQVCPNNRPLSR